MLNVICPCTEIDHNFSRAHRIVTTSILPIVSQYADHSRAVWDGSKVSPLSANGPSSKRLLIPRRPQFWKQFFEASANVSLSGYEELAASEQGQGEESETTYDTTTASGADDGDGYADTSVTNTTGASGADVTATPTAAAAHSSSVISSPSLTSSTPRAAPPAFAPYPSPYEALKQELSPSSSSAAAPPSTAEPSTPQAKLPSMNMTPTSSPFPTTAPTATRPGGDPLLHRVLDKNYRLLATPHSTRARRPAHQRHQQQQRYPPAHAHDSPLSSPAGPAPTLHAEIFSSPHMRTPGVSVLHQQKRKEKQKQKEKRSSQKEEQQQRQRQTTPGQRPAWESDEDVTDSDSDDGLPLGMSPPKTMHFAVPQSRLLRTPGMPCLYGAKPVSFIICIFYVIRKRRRFLSMLWIASCYCWSYR